MNLGLIGYRVLGPQENVDRNGGLYTYVLAANGLWAAASRPGLRAVIPVAEAQVHGELPPLDLVVELTPRVPAAITAALFTQARLACVPEPAELLLHLVLDGERWRLIRPAQRRGVTSVVPLPPFSGNSYETALIDVHSHHVLPVSDFSHTDDESEAGQFRIFGLLCDINKRPTLRTRVRIFNHAYEFDPELAFELPASVHTLWKDLADVQHGLREGEDPANPAHE